MPSPRCTHLLKELCGCPAPKKRIRDRATGRPTGQPRSPWRLRQEEEAKRLADLELRLIRAVEDGLGDQVLAATEIALAKLSFSKFCRLAWPVLEPSTYLEWGRHHELICTTLQALFEDWWRSKQERGYLPLVRNVLINTPPGSLKPVSVDGLVLEETRGYVRLGDIVAGDKILTHRGRYREVLTVAEQGSLPLIEFTTHRGRKIKVAGDHTMLTQRGWLRADHVTTRDVFASVHAIEPCGAYTVALEECRLFGYLIGDGCMQKNNASFTNQDPETITDFVKCADSVGFNTSLRKHVVGLKSRRPVVCVVCRRAKPQLGQWCRSCRYAHDRARARGCVSRVERSNSAVRLWLTKHGLLGKKSSQKRVPNAVMSGSDDIVAEYLAAYWACDGGIQDRRDQTTQSVRIDAVTISEGLARDHQALLQRLGLEFSLRKKVIKLTAKMCSSSGVRIGENYVTWHISASDQDTAAKFMLVVGSRIRHEKRTRASALERTRYDQVLNADAVTSIDTVQEGQCRCLQVKEDSSFVYQGIAVHNSRLISVFFHAWVWIRASGTKFVCVSVNESAAQRDARDTRALLLSNWYQDNFCPDWALKTDQDAISDFGNTDGGARLSRASGSVIVGLRGDCVAGETLVATDRGQISISRIHEMTRRGTTLPLAWSKNHANGQCELRAIEATRRIPAREVVDICTQADYHLRCTDDHKVFAEEDYTPASHLAGCQVSVLPRANMSVAYSSTPTVSKLPFSGPRKSDHVVQLLSHDPPQTRGDTVLSVDVALESGRRAKVDVYDIQVEGNHNFFAGGILVHNCLIGDDLNDPEESDKQLERDKVNSLWDTNQYNRVNDPLRSLRICVQQRIHVNDHTGHVIAKQGLWSPENRNGWLHIVLPAEMELSRQGFVLPPELSKYVAEIPDVELCDWRTEQGQPLHPARMPVEWLEGEKKRWAGTSNYAGQMQQRPTGEGGGKIKRAWFNWFRLARGVREGVDEGETGRPRPAECHKGDAVVIRAAHHKPGFWDFDQVVLSVDPAYKKTEKGSLWGILAFGCKGARKYLLDDRSQRGEPDEAIAILKQLVRMWRPDKILIEDKAGGAGMHRTLELEMAEGDTPMVELELVNPGTLDKDARINAAIPALANGMLYLLEGAPWLEEYVEELALYPNGMRNDRIDATTQAINHIRIDDCAYPSASAWSAALA